MSMGDSGESPKWQKGTSRLESMTEIFHLLTYVSKVGGIHQKPYWSISKSLPTYVQKGKNTQELPWFVPFASKNQIEDRLHLGITRASFASALGLHYLSSQKLLKLSSKTSYFPRLFVKLMLKVKVMPIYLHMVHLMVHPLIISHRGLFLLVNGEPSLSTK